MAEIYYKTLDEARFELHCATQEAKRLTLRISQLEALIAQLEALIGSSLPASAPLFEEPRPSLAVASQDRTAAQIPLWKAIIAALNGKKADFSVPEALAALERNGRHIESPNRKNIVRNTLIQRDDLFGRLGTGHYFVRGYEGTVIHEEMENGAVNLAEVNLS
jgi:hypothetical protein